MKICDFARFFFLKNSLSSHAVLLMQLKDRFVFQRLNTFDLTQINNTLALFMCIYEAMKSHSADSYRNLLHCEANANHCETQYITNFNDVENSFL